MSRPTASVIVPFAGSDAELDVVVSRLSALSRSPGDELLVADNRPAPAPGLRGPVRVLDARARRSSYFARQVGAQAASGDWLVFVDADTLPDPDLIDAYLDPLPASDVAVLAGAVIDTPAGTGTVVERYVGERRKLDQANTLRGRNAPYAQTANCAVRRDAFLAVGGFPDPVLSGGDADLCWRLQAAGHRLQERTSARVRHLNRARLGALLRQLHRHGAGMQWLECRYPGAFPPPRPRELAGRLVHYARRACTGDARFAAIDLLALCARDLGRLHSNGDPSRPGGASA